MPLKRRNHLGHSLNAKRSVKLGDQQTSVSVEDAFWKALNEIAASKHMSVRDLIMAIDKERKHANLSSVIRVFVLEHYRSHGTQNGRLRP